MTAWRDRMVGARMAVDNEYSTKVDSSSFTRQEWGLIMTAVEFDVHRADEPESAELYANTENISEIMPEVERVSELQSKGVQAERDSGGIINSVRSALGLADGDADDPNPERIEEAEKLVAGYASALQAYLEENESWNDILTAYREEEASPQK